MNPNKEPWTAGIKQTVTSLQSIADQRSVAICSDAKAMNQGLDFKRVNKKDFEEISVQ
jgi:hypothetical protein